jgi:hypothetical protein
MDNESSSPRKVKGALPQEWAKHFTRGLEAEVYGTRASEVARFLHRGQSMVASAR